MTAAERVRALGFARLWAERVAATPDRIAVVAEGRTLTMAELDDEARALAGVLVSRATDPTRPVLAVVESGLDAVICTYAGWLGGRGLARFDPRLPRRRQRELIAAIDPQVAVVDRAHWSLVDDLADGVVVVDPQAVARVGDVELLQPDGSWPESLLFTSGSTGRPKGLSASFSVLDARIAAQTGCFDYTSTDRVGLNLPASFGAARTVFHAPLWGAPLYLLDPSAGARVVGRWLDEQAITVAMLSPHLLREIIVGFEGDDRGGASLGPRLPGLRLVAPAADKVTGADVDAVRRVLNPHAEVVCIYGSSEAGPISALEVPASRPMPEGPLPVGRPVHGVEWWIDEPDETGAGRIVVRSACAASHYWNDPGLTEAVFRPDPDPARAAAGGKVVVGGDYGRLVDGEMVFLGRRDAVVKIRGYTVDLAEVEQRMLDLDDVAQVMVGVDEPSPLRIRIVAHVVPTRPGVTVSALRRGLAGWLPRYMLPGAIVFCDAFPRNDRGKVQLDALPAPGSGRPVLDQPYEAPATALEQQVAAEWSTVLGVGPVGRDDDFFDLGGDSLSMVEVTDRLSRDLGADLPIAVFEVPTLRACAAACERWRVGGRSSAILALQPTGEGVPVFCVHGGGGRPEVFIDLANAFGTTRPFYGVQVVGLDGMARLRSIGDSAAAYVDALVEILPAGPLMLAGFSGGGTVAFEMARLLARAGRQPELVILLDSRFVSRLPLRTDALSLRSWIAAGTRQAKRQIAMSEWTGRVPWPMKEWNRELAAQAREGRRRIRLGEPLDSALRRRMVMAEMSTGLLRWTARPYDGPVIALCTPGFGSLERWRVIASNLTVVEVPGDHGTFIRPPAVDHLVEVLEPWLAEIDATTQPTGRL